MIAPPLAKVGNEVWQAEGGPSYALQTMQWYKDVGRNDILPAPEIMVTLWCFIVLATPDSLMSPTLCLAELCSSLFDW